MFDDRFSEKKIKNKNKFGLKREQKKLYRTFLFKIQFLYFLLSNLPRIFNN